VERREFFRLAGLGGVAALFPFRKALAADGPLGFLGKAATPGCVLIPSETRGPYPLNLSGNAAMFRQNVTEGNAGTPLNLTLRFLNVNNNCAPIANARIDIWHCDKDGYYSGFSNQGYLGTRNGAGQTFFRGIQITDANGEVRFTTIYPGWYAGRVQHIHFEIYLNSMLSATSQLAFPETFNTAVNNTALYSAHGQNPTKNTNDGEFSDSANTALQIATIAANGSGGYDASLTAGISAPATGVLDHEPETGGQFKLRGVYPNPFRATARIPFWLAQDSNVALEIFDLQGRKALTAVRQRMAAGEQSVVLDRGSNALSLRQGSYAYQLTVRNEAGVHRQAKLLTVE
jgi:protocatechuate 3,4-dioxygenase beta subunit